MSVFRAAWNLITFLLPFGGTRNQAIVEDAKPVPKKSEPSYIELSVLDTKRSSGATSDTKSQQMFFEHVDV